MKYIRTKDGKIWSFSNPNNNFLYEGNDTKNGKWLHEIGEIVKEADTIEELCDEFIGVNKFNPKEHFTLAYKPKRQSDGMDVYGCIWTTGEYGEPILKAVTKPMNEKGEFELL